jgi:hypothetical protein
MIWLNARDCPVAASRVIRVDHRRWYVTHWVTSYGGAHWNYVQVRAVRPASHVRGLSLLPIIKRVEKMGLISRQWWLLNIEAGFEIWHGGRGLRTTSFSASVRAQPGPRRAPGRHGWPSDVAGATVAAQPRR